MDYSFPESKLGEGIQSKLGVVIPDFAKWTFQALLLANTGIGPQGGWLINNKGRVL
jgi:hypothetical protein